jgi:hypothetical protein
MGVGGFVGWGVGVGVRAGSREPSPFRSWPFGLRSLTHTILTDRVSLRTDSRPTAIAPLDHALRDSGTVPICALTRARSISTVRRCRTAPGTSFRCSLALCTSSCSGASEDRSVGSGAPAIHTHILNDTSGMPFVFMRRQGCHYFYADALKK